MGNRTSAIKATGQHSTKSMHHRKNAAIGLPLCHEWNADTLPQHPSDNKSLNIITRDAFGKFPVS